MATLLARGPRGAPAAGRALALWELRVLFGACADDAGLAGVRDAALLAVLYGAGLRTREAVALELADYSGETDTLRVRGYPGQPLRFGYLAPGSRAALETWCAERGALPGPLFWPIAQGQSCHARRLSPRAVYAIVQRRARLAGVEPVSPCDLRCTFLTDLLDTGVEPAVVRALAGPTPGWPEAPDALPDEGAKRRAVERLHVPYRPHAGEMV
jgi:site-specific recombinase XerD